MAADDDENLLIALELIGVNPVAVGPEDLRRIRALLERVRQEVAEGQLSLASLPPATLRLLLNAEEPPDGKNRQ